MKIEELTTKHYDIGLDGLTEERTFDTEHTKLSIQFAIEILNDLDIIYCGDERIVPYSEVSNKIEELKKYL